MKRKFSDLHRKSFGAFEYEGLIKGRSGQLHKAVHSVRLYQGKRGAVGCGCVCVGGVLSPACNLSAKIQ